VKSLSPNPTYEIHIDKITAHPSIWLTTNKGTQPTRPHFVPVPSPDAMKTINLAAEKKTP